MRLAWPCVLVACVFVHVCVYLILGLCGSASLVCFRHGICACVCLCVYVPCARVSPLQAYREEFLSVQELKREVEALKGKLEQQEAKTRAAQDQADECRDGVLRAAQAKAA